MMFAYQKFSAFSKFRFIYPGANEGQLFAYSTDLEKIGIQNDVSVPNGAYVNVVSEPILIKRDKYGGTISVIKVQADVAIDYHTVVKEFWVPTQYIIKIGTNAAQNSQLSN